MLFFLRNESEALTLRQHSPFGKHTCVYLQLSTHLSKISKLQRFVPKPFHVARIFCEIAGFRKKARCLQTAVIASVTLPTGDRCKAKTLRIGISDKCV